MLLTREEVDNALLNCPANRPDIRRGLSMMLYHLERGIEIKDSAPIWIQAKNVIFVNSIDNGEPDEGTNAA